MKSGKRSTHTPFIPSPQHSTYHTAGTAETLRKESVAVVTQELNVPSRVLARGSREGSREVCALDWQGTKSKAHTLPSRTQFGTRILVPSSSGTGLPSPLPDTLAIAQRGLFKLWKEKVDVIDP
jgi:hypothetical protein